MTDARGLRPRRSVDYTKPVAPGTPNWLRFSSRDAEQDVAGKDAGLIEKENSKPVVTQRKIEEKKPPKGQKAGKGKGLAPKRDAAAAANIAAAGDAAATDNEVKRPKDTNGIPVDLAEELTQAIHEQKKKGTGRQKQRQQDAAAAREEQQPVQPKARKSEPATVAEKAKPGRRKTAPEVATAKRSLAEEEAGSADKGRKRARADAVQPAEPDAVPRKAASSKAKPAASAETWSTTMTQKSDGNAAEEAAGKAGGSKTASRHKAALQAVGKLADAGKAKKADAAAAAALPAAMNADAKAAAQPASEPAKPSHATAAAPATAQPAAIMAAGPAAGPVSAFDYKKLQDEYAALQAKYQTIKEQRIQQLNSLLGQQSAKDMEAREAAMRLVEHWKREAERQAQFAQAAGSGAMRQELAKLRADKEHLQVQAQEAEAAVIEQQEVVAELRAKLDKAQRAAESPAKSSQGVQVTPGLAAAALLQQISAVAQPAGQQAPAPAMSPSAIESRALVRQRAPAVHLQEARACCPEGADLSETYHAPLHVPGASAPPGTGPLPPPSPASGCVECYMGAEPLVAYSPGCSMVAAQPSRSRFASEAQSRGASDDITSHQGDAAGAQAAQEASRAAAVSAPAVLTRHAWPPLHQPEAAADAQADAEAAAAGSAPGSDPSGMTQKALSTLVGLVAAPLRAGGFTYTHPATGFVFEMRPYSPGEEEEGEDDDATAEMGEQIAFKPLDMGPGNEVLPGYLREEIIFTATEKQKLVGRILEALGTLTMRAARDAAQQQQQQAAV